MRRLPLALIVATMAFTIAVYGRLPEQMAIHWNATGEPDGFGSRAFGAFLLPFVVLAIWGLLIALPKLDPRSANIEKFRDAYDVLVAAVIAVMCLLHICVLGSALGWPIDVGRVAPIGIGALFVVIGTLLPRFQSNFFFGIRTPWTLSSETVWARTHQVGGYVLMGIGLLLMLAGIVGTSFWLYVAIGGGFAMAIFVVAYSYLLWRTEQDAE